MNIKPDDLSLVVDEYNVISQAKLVECILSLQANEVVLKHILTSQYLHLIYTQCCNYLLLRALHKLPGGLCSFRN